MKRSPILRKTAMARTAISRSPILKSSPARKTGMKSKGPRMTPIRRAARGQECTLQLPGCNHDPETTVLCHSNYLIDGKGMGLKAPDAAAAFGCSACHDVLDGRKPIPEGFTRLDMEAAFYVAIKRTHEILKQKGLMPKSESANDCESRALSTTETN